MRNAFVRAMCELAESDDRVFLVTADLGWGALEPFANRFPDRFLNVGIAEQNMLGGGFAYGHAGPTHHALEDLTICRTQPGLTVLAPCDPDQPRPCRSRGPPGSDPASRGRHCPAARRRNP